MSRVTLNDAFGAGRQRQPVSGEVEVVYRDPATGQEFTPHRGRNIIKIQAKEVLSHRLAHSRVWDPSAAAGAGAWVSSGVDLLDELSMKYIVFGASFDADGEPLDSSDSRFYVPDAASGGYAPVALGPGADFGGGLINPIPISEPLRPLKRIERVYFESSYQPAGSPLLQGGVRALNNVVVMETTLRADEYNGFGGTSSDYFTITEVGLVGGVELGATGACECDPHSLFLSGSGGTSGDALAATATGTATVTLAPSEAAYVDVIREGDTVKLVGSDGTVGSGGDLGQVSPFYLVVRKAVGGSDVELDRAPADADGVPLTGAVGLFRDGWRLAAHRILDVPVKKSSVFEVVVRWKISMA